MKLTDAICVFTTSISTNMCSITAILNNQGTPEEMRSTALQISKLQRHRGPDWSGVYQNDSAVLVHERLAIVDVTSGAQPLIDPEHQTALAVNGEIYNHKNIRKSTANYPYQTGSDCVYAKPSRRVTRSGGTHHAFQSSFRRRNGFMIRESHRSGCRPRARLAPD